MSIKAARKMALNAYNCLVIADNYPARGDCIRNAAEELELAAQMLRQIAPNHPEPHPTLFASNGFAVGRA